MEDEYFQGLITNAVNEKIRVVNANRERYIEAWIAETGLMPSESQLVEKHLGDGTILVTVKRQKSADTLSIELAAMLQKVTKHLRERIEANLDVNSVNLRKALRDYSVLEAELLLKEIDEG